MNKTFKHVTNTKNGELVSGVAAETARTAGGLGAASVAVGTGPAQASAKATLWGLKAMAWAVLALCGSLSHAAAPVGVVAHGEASLVTQGSVLNVHQSSKAATINFQQLNLGKGEGVAVQARSATDITLLRVAGGMNVNGGFVTANNNLMISSPSGIAVSNGGKVSAQGEVYMTTQNMAVGQYTKPAARASAGAISVTGHSQISGSNIVLDAGSIHLSQATLTAAPVQKTDGITLQAATVSVQDSSLNAAGGQISIGLDPQGTYAQSTTISASTLSAQAVQVAGIELKVDSTNTLTTETARLQTVDMKIDADLAQLTSNVLATGSDVQLQGDNSVSMARDVAIEVNSAHSNALRIATTGSNNNSPTSPSQPLPNQVALLGTIQLNGGRKFLGVHSSGDLNLEGTVDVSGDATFQAIKTLVVNGATVSAVGDLTIGRDAFGQGALSHHTVVFESALSGYNIETSGDTLTTQGVTARTTGGQWLLDPTNINITNTASTGGTLADALAAAGTSNILTTDIQSAINAGTDVNIVATGTITVSNALSFSIVSGLTGTLTLDNRSATALTTIGSYSNVGINIKSSITNNGAGTVNLKFLSAGTINVNNSFDNVNKTSGSGISIRSTSGKLNVLMQSNYFNNTNGSIFGSNIYIYGNITTRGGYITLDGTGGSVAQNTVGSSIAGETITPGSIANGAVYVESYANLNTVSDASTTITSSTVGGNINVASSRNRSTSAGAFEQGLSAPIRSGGQFNLNTSSSGDVVFNFVTFNRQTSSGIYAAGDVNIISSNTSTAINPTNTGVLNFTSPIYSYGGEINIQNTSTAAGVIGINALNAIIGREGVNIVNNSVGQIGINTRAPATAVVPPGGSFSSTNGLTSITNTSTGAFSGIYLRGTVAGKAGVAITNTSESGTGTNSGIYVEAAVSSSAGSILIDSTTTTGTAITYPTTTVAGAATTATAFSAVDGINIIGASALSSQLNSAYGAVSINKAVINSGIGGINMQSTGNIRVANVTDQGSGDIEITGGFNIASGTVTGGTILGVGTLTNTGGGVISLSMATPTSATGGVIEDAAGVTNAVASVSSNVSYGNVGGVMGATDAATVNSVNYRSVVSGSTAINLEVENYEQEYGTAYNGTVANTWLNDSNNVTYLAISGSSSGFGIVPFTTADALASLRFAGNLGSGGNSNLVQSGTDLSVPGAITSSYGTVNVTPRANKNTYTITPKALTITGSMASSVYDGVRSYADVSAAGTTYAGLLTSIGGVATGDAVTGLTRSIASATAPTLSGVAQVGTFNDTLSNAIGTGLSNYIISYVPGNFSVSPANLTVTGGNKTSTYNATVQNNATYSVTGLLGTDTVSSVSGVASGTTVGTYNDSLSAAQGTGLSNYNIAYTNGALTIGKAALTITSAASSATYTGGAQTGTFTVSGLQGTVDAVTGISGAASGTNAGTYTSALGSATGTGLENYEITYANTGTFTIDKANATLVGAVNTSVYNGNAQTNTGAVFTGLLGNDATTISATGYAQATHVAQGVVADNLGATGTNAGNYNFAVTNGSLRITPKALSVVGAQTTSVYNAATQTNTYTTTGLVGTDAISVTGSASARNVSTTNDALSVAFTTGAASNYTTTITDGFLKITPAIISVSGILAADKAYDGTTSATLSGTPTISGVLGGDAVSVNAGSLTGVFDSKNAGSQNVSISGIGLTGDDAGNYQLSGGTTATTTATITPKTLSVSGTSLSSTYNAANQALAAPTVTGLVAGDNVIVSGNASGTNAGTYTATFAIAGTDSGNYALSANAPVLTIGKAALVVTADNNAKFVTQNDPSTLTAQVSGFQGSETASSLGLTYTVARQAGETVAGGSGTGGAYTITPSGASSLTNYTVTYVPGLFTISPAGAVLIKMNPTTSTYGTVVGGTIASVEYVTSTGGSVLRTLTLKSGSTDTYTDGVGGEITITPTTTVTPTTGVGTYAGAISNTNNGTLTSNGNFSAVETVVNTAVVNQASLTLTLNPVTKTYDASPFSAAGASAEATGLMNGQTLASLGPITYSGAAIGAINASATPYALLGSVGSGFANYNVTIAPSSLTINPAPLQITGGTNTYTFNNTQRTNTYAITSGQLFGSDSVTGLTGLATLLHAGTTPDNLTAATGVGLSNYSISFVNGGLTINPAQLYALATPTNAPVYNGSTAVPNTTVLSGVIGGTLVSGTTSLALSGADVGAQTIVNSGTVLSGPNAGDYVVVSSNLVGTSTNQVTPNIVGTGNGGGSVTITPAPLTITGGTTSHVFNNTQRTNTFSVTGQLFGSDSVTGVTGLGTGLRANTSANLVYADNLSDATGNGIANYAITYFNGGLTIMPAPLTALATPNATTYSGGTSVANTTVLNGIIAGTDVSGTTSLVLGSPNAGTQTIINNGTTLSGDFASDYYVVSSNLVGTTPNQVTPNLVTTGNGGGSIVVAQAPLSIVGDTWEAVYNGTAQTNTVTITGAVNNETITASGSAQATNVSEGAVNDVLVAVAGSGVNLNNYAITITNGSLSITPATITLGGITANNKVYDGTDSATLNVGTVSFNGVLPVDNGNVTVNTSALTAQFDGDSAQDGKTVYISGISIGGAAASNYQLSGGTTATATANITAAPLTITGATTSHVFNNTLHTNTFSVTGQLFGNDSVETVMGLGTGLRANTSANPVYADNLSDADGIGINNYDITYVNGGLTITPAPLTALATPNATTYSGGTNVANTTVLNGIIAGTDVSGTTSLVLGSPNAGTQTIINNGTTLSGDFASDYYVVSSNLVGTTPNQVTPNLVTTGNGGGSIVVAQAPLSIVGDTSSVVYNGTAQTNTVTITGAVNNETITASGSAQATNVSQGTVNDVLVAVAGSGVNLNNYAITITNGSLSITPATITLGGITANNKVYDGTDSATPNVGTVSFNGVLSVDDGNVTVDTNSLIAQFDGDSAQDGKTVYISGISIGGAAASNYQLSGGTTATATANITAAPLTITGATTSHVFNNTERTNTFSVTGQLFGSDSVTGVTGLGTGLRANTSANLVYADNLSDATGDGLSNYAITYVNGGLTITPAPLTALATPNATTYSGGTNVANTTVLNGIIAGTDVSGTTSLVLGSPNAGTQTIINNGTTLSGDFASDYYVVSSNLVGTTPNQVTPNLVTTGNGGGSIVVAKAPATVLAIASSATADGTTKTQGYTQTGVMAGDDLGVSGLASGMFAGEYASALSASNPNYDVVFVDAPFEILASKALELPQAPESVEPPHPVPFVWAPHPAPLEPLDPFCGLSVGLQEIQLAQAMASKAPAQVCGFDTSVLFDFGSAVLNAPAKEQLRQCQFDPSKPLLISGFVDAEGTRLANIGLGKRRALAVKDFMASELRVPTQNIRMRLRDKTNDAAVSAAEWGQAASCRVHVSQVPDKR